MRCQNYDLLCIFLKTNKIETYHVAGHTSDGGLLRRGAYAGWCRKGRGKSIEHVETTVPTEIKPVAINPDKTHQIHRSHLVTQASARLRRNLHQSALPPQENPFYIFVTRDAFDVHYCISHSCCGRPVCEVRQRPDTPQWFRRQPCSQTIDTIRNASGGAKWAMLYIYIYSVIKDLIRDGNDLRLRTRLLAASCE